MFGDQYASSAIPMPAIPFISTFTLHNNTMLTDMDKLVLDSMIQNDETIETMILVLGFKFRCETESAGRYLVFKKLRAEIEAYLEA